MVLSIVVLPIPAKSQQPLATQLQIEQGILLAGGKQNQQFHLSNLETQQHYLIQVFKPNVPTPKDGFPVLYLLDGNAAFPYASVIAQSYEFSYTRLKKTPPIVVAIGYPITSTIDVKSRTYDYTPPYVGEFKQHPDRPASPYAQGGAEQFFQFVQKKLKPAIQAHYPINMQQQTLFGHSYGGLFTLYTLLHHPDAFQNYVAASPSLWWNDAAIVGQANTFKQKYAEQLVQKTTLLLSIGTLELKEKITPKAEKHGKDTPSLNHTTPPSLQEFAHILSNVQNLDVQNMQITDATHFEAMFPAINQAFKIAIANED